jgi:hypothetical protein
VFFRIAEASMRIWRAWFPICSALPRDFSSRSYSFFVMTPAAALRVAARIPCESARRQCVKVTIFSGTVLIYSGSGAGDHHDDTACICSAT